jgi:hypothetical protein
MDDLNLNVFDLNDMNYSMTKLPRIFCKIYEKELAPMQRSIDIVERKYFNG